MKLKIKMKMKTNKKKGGSFFPPLVQLSQNTGGRAASPSCKYQWRPKKTTNKQQKKRKNKKQNCFVAQRVLELLQTSFSKLS